MQNSEGKERNRINNLKKHYILRPRLEAQSHPRRQREIKNKLFGPYWAFLAEDVKLDLPFCSQSEGEKSTQVTERT